MTEVKTEIGQFLVKLHDRSIVISEGNELIASFEYREQKHALSTHSKIINNAVAMTADQFRSHYQLYNTDWHRFAIIDGGYKVTKTGIVTNKYGNKLDVHKDVASGKPIVRLMLDYKPRNMPLAKFVAMFHLDNPENFSLVGHKDDDEWNCHVENLYWYPRRKRVSDGKRIFCNAEVAAKYHGCSQSHVENQARWGQNSWSYID